MRRVEQLVCCAEGKGIDYKGDIIEFVMVELEEELISDINGLKRAGVLEYLEEVL